MNNSVMQQNSSFQEEEFLNDYLENQKINFNRNSINIYNTLKKQEILQYLTILNNCYLNDDILIFNNNATFIEPEIFVSKDFKYNIIAKNNPTNFKEILLQNDKYNDLSSLGNYNLSEDEYLSFRDFI